MNKPAGWLRTRHRSAVEVAVGMLLVLTASLASACARQYRPRPNFLPRVNSATAMTRPDAPRARTGPAVIAPAQPQHPDNDRVVIAREHDRGRTVRAAAALLRRSASTVSRELWRNSAPAGAYRPARAALSRSSRVLLWTFAAHRTHFIRRRSQVGASGVFSHRHGTDAGIEVVVQAVESAGAVQHGPPVHDGEVGPEVVRAAGLPLIDERIEVGQ